MEIGKGRSLFYATRDFLKRGGIIVTCEMFCLNKMYSSCKYSRRGNEILSEIGNKMPYYFLIKKANDKLILMDFRKIGKIFKFFRKIG